MVTKSAANAPTSDTKEHILQTAQALAQRRGFNAFSYADISEAIGIRKASIHHHFAAKEDLELALVERYRNAFGESLVEVEATEPTAAGRLRAYAGLYGRTLESGHLCLCGMMASDLMALPDAVRAPLREFFTDQVTWLSHVLEVGRRTGEITFRGAPVQKAQTILAALQGGLMIARSSDDPAFFESLVADMLGSVGH
jgi:TetR/AcrR family transcriptional regulator, transcriptional repressor for nem operon